MKREKDSGTNETEIKRIHMGAGHREQIVRLALMETVVNGMDELGSRFALVPGAKRDFGLIKTLISKLFASALKTVPVDQLVSLKKQLTTASFHMGVRSVTGGKHYDDYGVWLSYNDYRVILEALSEKCSMCLEDPVTVKSCPLRKALDHIGTDVEHKGGCGYSSALQSIEME